ncbi:MAG: DNA-binding protein [Gammaproteobacteria bacterium]|nr:DNA-binding protein [Gammaproteobacteria bacterium]
MSLSNLEGKTLERIEPDAETIGRLLAAARRNIADARVTQISAENRFDAAYKAVMQLANVALQANGYRTLTSRPGHHMTMIQTLGQTLGLDSQSVILLDALRKQRNVADYAGDPVPESAVEECLARAEVLLQDATRWLEANRPDLLR